MSQGKQSRWGSVAVRLPHRNIFRALSCLPGVYGESVCARILYSCAFYHFVPMLTSKFDFFLKLSEDRELIFLPILLPLKKIAFPEGMQ